MTVNQVHSGQRFITLFFDGLVMGVFFHLRSQPVCFLLHLAGRPRLATVVVNSREAPSLFLVSQIFSSSSFLVLQLGVQVCVLALQHGIDGVGAALGLQIKSLTGDNVGMDVRHALAGVYAVLDGDVEGRGIEDALDHARDVLHRQEQVGDLGGRQIVETRHDPARRDQDMPRQQWLEIDDGEGQAGQVEDLPAA